MEVCDTHWRALSAGACVKMGPDQTRVRAPSIEQGSPWYDRLDTAVKTQHDSIVDENGQMLVVFCQGTAKAYPRYLVDLEPKAGHALHANMPMALPGMMHMPAMGAAYMPPMQAGAAPAPLVYVAGMPIMNQAMQQRATAPKKRTRRW